MAEENVLLKRRKKKAPVTETVSPGLHSKSRALKKTTIQFDPDIFLKMKIRIAHLDMNMKDYLESLIAADTESA